MSDDLALQNQARALAPFLRPWMFGAPFYAENTYTPTYTGGTTAGTTTYSIQSGTYIRLGSLVIAWGTVVWTNATGTGDARISLPFAANATGNRFATGAVRTVNITFANSAPQVQIDPGNQYLTLESPLTNAAATRVQMEVAGNLVFVAVYTV